MVEFMSYLGRIERNDSDVVQEKANTGWNF